MRTMSKMYASCEESGLLMGEIFLKKRLLIEGYQTRQTEETRQQDVILERTASNDSQQIIKLFQIMEHYVKKIIIYLGKGLALFLQHRNDYNLRF